ncbi:Helix-turn-helix domain protein [compost metagenome]
MPFNAHCGERLRAERERLGLTQQQMADAAGVRREMWSKYERGVAVPGGDVFEALAALRVDLMFVLAGDAPTSLTPQLPADEQLLLDTYRGLSAAKKKQLLASLLTGSVPQRKKPAEGISVAGNSNRVAGRDYNEEK